MKRGGSIYVAYITSRPRFDATFIKLREKPKQTS